MQPSGNLHIGNYLGALKNWVRIQQDYECIFCIVDLHAFTLYHDPAALRAKIREIAALYLASGLDPHVCSIMVQSSVPAHAELAWMLTCVTPIGWLERMTQYKAKAAKQESVGDGLLQYPVLMAADILLYQAPAELSAKIREIAALYLASGLDPKVCSIMVQSAVPAHAELAWMLTCVTPVGWLERMTQYKVKAAKQESVSDGLLQYPVLMAADILLYQAGIVPVGEDQSQHVELTRDVAQRFNSLYGETFVVPGTSLPAVGARIMGLDDPTQKMSKSETAANHAVALLDPPDKIRKTIMRATTDSKPAVDCATAGPGILNLLAIYQAFSGDADGDIERRFNGMRYGDLKKQVAEMAISHLEPFQQRYRRIVSDPGYLDGVLREGAERVAPIANSTVKLVKERMGLYI